MIYLDKNENTILQPQLANVLENIDFRKYSFEQNHLLHRALAEHFNAQNASAHALNEDNFILGAGSSDCIFMFFCAIRELANAQGRAVVVLAQRPSFEVVLDFARALGFSVHYLQDLLRANFSSELAAASELAAEPKIPADAIKVHYECNPNNPTGIAATQERIRELEGFARSGDFVVVDEAYAEFNPQHLSPMMASERILHVRTFSKAYALAGARMGYACASSELIRLIKPFYNPDRINTFALHLALRALANTCFLPRLRAAMSAQRARMQDFLRAHEVFYYPTCANFILHEIKSSAYKDFLAAQGIICAKTLHAHGRLFSRISVGNEAQTSALLAAWQNATALKLL